MSIVRYVWGIARVFDYRTRLRSSNMGRRFHVSEDIYHRREDLCQLSVASAAIAGSANPLRVWV